MLDWLIIGGGVHGTHLSNVLIHKHGVPRDRLVVLDPYDEPMERWKHCTNNTGMTHLRSPAVHHVGLKPMGLLDFARSSAGPLAELEFGPAARNIAGARMTARRLAAV